MDMHLSKENSVGSGWNIHPLSYFTGKEHSLWDKSVEKQAIITYLKAISKREVLKFLKSWK